MDLRRETPARNEKRSRPVEVANTHACRALALSGLCILGVACSGDSSSYSGGAVQETYSADAFSYVDPSPPQPLQRVRTDVVRRDEAAILLRAEQGQLLDYNQGPGGVEVSDLPALPKETFGLTSGRIDGDSDTDVLVAHVRALDNGGLAFEVSRLEHSPSSAWMPVYSMPMPRALRDVTLAAGDIDADGLDEIVLAYRWTRHEHVELLVIDDLESGAPLLDSHTFPYQPGELEVTLGDLDGDGSDEIVLSNLVEEYMAVEVVQAGETSVAIDDYILRDRYARPAFLRLGEFDDESAEKELLVGFFRVEEDPAWGSINRQYELVRLDLVEGSLEQTGSTRLGEWNETIASDWVVADTDGDQADELFLVCRGCVHQLRPGALLERPSWEHGIELVARVEGEGEVQLAAGDEDGDGLDEVFVLGRTELMRIGLDPEGELVVNERRDLGELPKSPCLWVGDYDGDSTVIAHTGGRELVLCEAFPLIVMAAPPRKAWSGQQVADATTTYGIGGGESHTTWSGATLTVRPSFAVDVDGRFKRELLREFAKTGTPPAFELGVEAFSTGWKEDKVLFCGALYQSFEYEVVADVDPVGVGSVFTIDVPVDVRTFFWSVDDYNATFERQIAGRMLGHTVGDPASYLGLREAQALQARYVGWLAPSLETVASGWTYTEQELAPTFLDPTTAQWRTPIDEQVGLRTGPKWGAACLALAADGDIHRVTNRTATLFRGTVGDLPPKSHAAWGYDYGLLVYTLGHLSGPDNTPSGCEPGVLPCQVVTYTVRPWGAGY
jgi:hypothetical protein